MTTTTKTQVSIKPYLSGQPNGGYEKYDMVVAGDAIHREDLGFAEQNGIKIYKTGLNELAPEIQGIKDREKKEAAILNIRKQVVFLENSLAGNYEITEEDIYEKDDKGKKTNKFSDKFWNKVKMFISQGPDRYDGANKRIPTYWDKVTLACGNNPKPLNPTDPHDLILLNAIRANGFGMIAPSLDDARNAIYPPKFYLDKTEETAAIKTEYKKQRALALGELSNMFTKDPTKLRYVVKMVSTSPLSYNNSTPLDVVLDDVDRYIMGETEEKNKKVTAERFLEYAKMDLAELRIQAIVKDAIAMQLMTYHSDGNIYYTKTGTPCGKSIQEVVKYIENPLNDDIRIQVTSDVEEEWKK